MALAVTGMGTPAVTMQEEMHNAGSIEIPQLATVVGQQ